MLKRVSIAWMPVAIVLLLVGYWLGQKNPVEQVRGSKPSTQVEAPKPSTDEPVAPAAPPATDTTPQPDGMGGSALTSDPPPAPDRDPPARNGSPEPTGTGTDALGGGTGTTTGTGTRDYGTGDDTTAGTGTRDYGTGDDTAGGLTDRDYGTGADDTTTDYGTGTTTDYGTGTTTDYGTGTTTDYGTDTTTRVKRELAYTFHVFDGFEAKEHSWAVESAADHAVPALSKEKDKASEGEASLKVTFKAYGKGQFELRREVNLDFTDATTAKVDVYNEGGPMDLLLACRAGYDTTLFQTPSKGIAQGWNRDVTFSLADLSAGDTGGFGTSWTWSRDSVSRVSLIVRERDEKEGTIYIDNLRFDRPAAELGHKAKPDGLKMVASGKLVERFDTFELDVTFQADYQDFFDRTKIGVAAAFFAPSGTRLDVHGFVHDIDAETAKPTWKVRFTPSEVGLWRYDVTVKSAAGDAASATHEFTCQRKADRRGFIRRSRRDRRYFELDDGSFYYPLGQNVCWASNYDHFLEKIQGYGGNYVRVWLCPWNLQLEDPTEPGKFDLRVAAALDKLLAMCARRGIYVQLALRYHGMHQGDWAKSPYSTTNGGPCFSAGTFFTNLDARDQHKAFLDYVVARWGHSTALFAWELWNEADLARSDRDSDLVAWHKEMANYLKTIDPYKHLVTTSVASPGKHPELFELANIDFVPVHFYSRDVFNKIHDNYIRHRELRKPVFIGEFSGGHKPADDLADTKGLRIHAGLWMTFVTPMAGSAMPWWWDTHIDKNDLYGHWAALARFAKGVDRRGKNYEVVRSRIKVGEDAWASIQGLVAPAEALLWVYDEARILRPEHTARPLLIADRPTRLHGMLGGTFRIEIWDTYEGKILKTSTADTADGTLAFTLPKCDRDIAVKIVKEGEAHPAIEW